VNENQPTMLFSYLDNVVELLHIAHCTTACYCSGTKWTYSTKFKFCIHPPNRNFWLVGHETLRFRLQPAYIISECRRGAVGLVQSKKIMHVIPNVKNMQTTWISIRKNLSSGFYF